MEKTSRAPLERKYKRSGIGLTGKGRGTKVTLPYN
jgi:hypothetical protein